MAFVFLRVGTWVHLILNLTHTSKRWPDQFSKSGRDISKSISIPAKLVQQNWNQHEIMQLWEIDFFFFPKNVLRPFLISHKLYCLNGVPFKHSTTKEKVTYRPFSHAKQSHTEALQGRGTETPITTTDTQNNQVCFLFLVCVFTAFLCILLHSLQTSLRLKKSFSFQDSTPFQIIPDTQLSIIPTGSLIMGDFNVFFFYFFFYLITQVDFFQFFCGIFAKREARILFLVKQIVTGWSWYCTETVLNYPVTLSFKPTAM